jgi:hypothetical protein
MIMIMMMVVAVVVVVVVVVVAVVAAAAVAVITISKSLRQYLSNILGKYKIKEKQKTAILGTAHILWNVLM